MTEMENNNKSGNNFFSGFLLGALLGAAIVLLFVTKKGKKILKAISEEGEGKISNILNKIESSVDLDEITEEEPSFSPAAEKEESLPLKKFIAKEVIEERPKTRRFFRGISRHVN
ncbi:MAG: hypothetical protein HW400_171 [Candidatus Levybacteria bacterium]|nr:hypothetical protein [Candidatus Levybacteria bacterium]